MIADAKPWVAELYFEKFRYQLDQGYRWHHYWTDLNEQEFNRHLTILENLPEDSPILAKQRDTLKTLLENDSSLTALQKDRLQKLLEQPAAE